MLGSVLLIGCLLAAQGEAAADDDLKLQVRRLARRLDAPQLAQREAAEEAWPKMGPGALALLPRITERTSAEAKLRIGRIRQKLQRAAAEAAARASTVTLRGKALPLSEIVAAIGQQTGNKLVDFRRRFGHEITNPKLAVDFDKTPFWEALDEVLDRAALKVYPFGEEGAISFVARGEGELPRSGRATYSGPLRLEPLSITGSRRLRDPQGDSLQLTLEVAWEPRLKPISLKQKMADLAAVDENGNPLAVDDRRAEREAATGDAAAVELILPLKLPPREVKRIASFKGTLTAIVPGKIETFRFDDLVDARNVEKRIAGVTVTLQQVRRNNQSWEVRVRVRFDEAGEALASHRGWIFNNEAYLEGPDDKPIPYDSLETTVQKKNEVGVAYLFRLDGPPADHQFVYKTPGVILATGFDYEIKDVKLP